jgi:putative ABC transport system substrate-binding protein
VLKYVFYFCLLCTSATATSQTVLIIGNTEHKIDQAFQTALSNRLDSLAKIQLFNYHYADFSESLIDTIQPDLVLSIGIKAAHKVKHLSTPVLFTFLPEMVAKEITPCIALSCLNQNLHFFIVLDQPIDRQIGLIKFAFPQAKTIGVLTSDFSQYKIPALIEAGQKNQLFITYQFINETSDINYEIRKFINRKFDILLSLPDPLVHNNKTIPYLLLSTYNQNIPVIGFSETYVNAGAIGAVYSTIEQLAEQTFETTLAILNRQYPLKKIQYPQYFNVAINQHVAKSLDLYLVDQAILKKKLSEVEQ